MPRLSLVVSLMLVGVTLVVGSLVAVAKPAGGNNSDAAKACQKGGYATLARSTDPTLPFRNPGECTSYAAKGGTLVPHAVPTETTVVETGTTVVETGTVVVETGTVVGTGTVTP